MIQKLIDQYLAGGGRAPYAVLFAPGVYDDVPLDVLVAWTPSISDRVIVVPLFVAAAFLHESSALVVKREEPKEITVDESA